MEDTKPAETNEERKARLLAEAKELGAKVSPEWTADDIEKVVAKKRAAAPAKAKETPPAQDASDAGVEGDENSVEAPDLVGPLIAELAAKNAELDRANAKLKAANDYIFEIEAAKSKAETELFDLKAAAEGIKDKPEVTEDFGGKKEAVSGGKAKQSPDATILSATVTKLGAGKIFTGNGTETYPRGAKFTAPAVTMASLEERGFAEVD